MKRPLGTYLVLVLATLTVQELAAWAFGDTTPSFGELGRRWVWFDGHRYLEIAQDGYSWDPGAQSNVAWFPLYPLLIRGGAALGLRPDVAGSVVSLLAGAAAFVLFDRWLSGRGVDGRGVTWSLATLAVMPYAFYLYGIVYSDALFLALCLGAIVAYERGLLTTSLTVAALATATRPTGIALVAYLAVAELERGRCRRTVVVPVAACAGVGAYVTFLWIRFDAPFGFATTQRYFRGGTSFGGTRLVEAVVDGVRSAGPPAVAAVILLVGGTAMAAAWVRRRWSTAAALGVVGVGAVGSLIAARWPDVVAHPGYRSTTAAQALLCVGAAVSVPAVARRFGRPAAALVAVTVLVPTVSSGDFMGAGRYLIAAFPLWALWGRFLADRGRVGVVVMAASAVAMLCLSVAFTRGGYIA